MSYDSPRIIVSIHNSLIYEQQITGYQSQDFNDHNLLNVAKTADYKKYARKLIRILFTHDELSNSTLISNPNYTRPGLDHSQMQIWQRKL